jgi:hypothetical protein
MFVAHIDKTNYVIATHLVRLGYLYYGKQRDRVG